MRYTRISADCHIDMPWLPPDLFTANASALMKDRMPYVVDGPDGPQWTTKKGAPFGLVGGIGSTGTKYVPGQNHRVDVMASTGLYEDGKVYQLPRRTRKLRMMTGLRTFSSKLPCERATRSPCRCRSTCTATIVSALA